MAKLLGETVRSIVAWVILPRPGALLIRTGLALVALGLLGGLATVLSFPLRGEQFYFQLDTNGGTPLLLSTVVVFFGLASLVAGSLWSYGHYRAEQSRLSNQRVVVVELQGLRAGPSTPLSEAVPSRLKGRRERLVIDVRGPRDGEVSDPEAALENLESLPTELKRRRDGFDDRDIAVVYGGLASVPFLFLAGVLIDDETSVEIMDWDRHRSEWRELTEEDDGKRFEIDRSSGSLGTETEVVVALSVSYEIDPANIARKFPNTPLVQARLQDGKVDVHWSEQKQIELCRQFLDLMVEVGNAGVGRVHLVLAAPASLSFRMGRTYDKRNLPELIVYQYERGADPAYPWGIAMPVAGRRRAAVV